ncbi:MAG TPA: competence protein CoiA family protein [Gemmatimonadaceae bacterium]
MEPLGLSWVIVGGRPSHVSHFAALPPRSRPAATCPECGRRLTLKLGRVRRHHAAHAPNDRCIATRPETALHLDCKFHIAAALREAIRTSGAQALRVSSRCAGTGGEQCDATYERVWSQGWDDVFVEATMRTGSQAWRPDILLRRGGEPVGAIEVLVRHAVGDDKAVAIGAAGVPWIEVRADAVLLEDGAAWTFDRPLPVTREGGGAAPNDMMGWSWRCSRHDAEHRAHLARESQRREAEREASRRASALIAARVVDVYDEGGARDRIIYRMVEQRVDARIECFALIASGREIARAPADDSPESRRAARHSLRVAFAADVERRASRPGAFADSPMRWAAGDTARNLVDEGLYDVAGADPTPLATRYPRRWFYARERGAWFLPREMRNVRWDRPESDAFVTHPAWTASRSAVRERPVPVEAWRTFVFASRPSVVGLGSAVRLVRQEGPISLVAVGLDGDAGAIRCVLVLLTAAAADSDVRRISQSLLDADVRHLWLSHPLDWSASRGDLAWAPAGRDSRGRGLIVVDGLGVFRAEPFLRAFARGERRLAPAAIRARLAERVAALRAR